MERTNLGLVLIEHDKVDFYVQGTDQLIGTITFTKSTSRKHITLFFQFPSQVAIIRQKAKHKISGKIKTISRKES